MPKHLLSGIKAIVTFKLKEKGLSNKEIANILKCDRSVISHYLRGTFPKKEILDFVKIIENLPPACGARLIHGICKDKELSKILIKELYNVELIWDKEKCIFCGTCKEECNAIKMENLNIIIDYNNCSYCGLCVLECPVKALKFIKKGEINEKS